MMSRCLKRNVVAEFCQLTDNVLVMLANWNLLTSFVEADWWHFTDPAKSGFSLVASSVFFFSILLPPVFLFFRCIRCKLLSPIEYLILKLVSPGLLLLSSLPVSETSPATRTAYLAIGVSLMPLTVTWLKRYPAIGNSNRQYSFCRVDLKCMSNEKWRHHPQSANNNHSPKYKVACDQAEFADNGAEILFSVFLSMAIRWCFMSVNVFYEIWKSSLILFVVILALGLVRLLIDHYVFAKHLWCRRSAASSLTSSMRPVLKRNITGDADEEAPMKSDQNVDRSITCSFSALKLFCIQVCAIIHGISLGTNLLVFLWLFCTPSLLCRWSGRPSEVKYEMIIISAYATGTIFAIFQPHQRLFRNSTSKENQCLHKKFYFGFQFGFALSIIILVFSATIMLLQGALSCRSFAGSILLCLFLPYLLSLTMQSIGRISNFSNCSQIKCKCLKFLPGLIALSAGFSFVCFHLLLLMFINPQMSSSFLGRMDLILTMSIIVLSFSVFAYIPIENIWNRTFQIPHICNEEKSSRLLETTKYKILSHRRAIFFSALTVLVLIIVFPIGPHLISSNCLQRHKETSMRPINASGSDAFSVLSWNVLLGHDMKGRDNLPCVGAVIKELDPSIIGLQESDASPPYWGGKDILGFLVSYLGGNVKSYPGVEPLKSSLGVGILTSLRVNFHESFILPTDVLSKVPHYSMTKTNCTVGNNTLIVFNVHAVYKNWTARDDNPSPYANLSTEQTEYIAAKVKEIDPAHPIMIMGDFNLNPNESQLDVFYNRLQFENALHQNRTSYNVSTLRNRFAVVDHIFYRGLKLQEGRIVTETANISDHHPIIARFEMYS